MAIMVPLFVGMGALCVVLALPLLLRWVKPNPLYGFRTPQTLRDPRLWYEANAYAGRLLVGMGVVIIVMALGLFYLVPSLPVAVYALAMGAVTAAGALASLLQALRYLRRLDEQSP